MEALTTTCRAFGEAIPQLALLKVGYSSIGEDVLIPHVTENTSTARLLLHEARFLGVSTRVLRVSFQLIEAREFAFVC